MRLVTYEATGPLGPIRRSGALQGEHVLDLGLARAAQLASRGNPRATAIAAAELPADMLEFLRGGDFALETAREALDHVAGSGVEEVDGAPIRHDLATVRLLSPLPRPNSLRDYLCFEEHLRNCYRTLGRENDFPPEWFNLPAHYKGNPDRIFGPEDVVPYPTITGKLDYELEICAVVGKSGYRVKAEGATPYIVGYTLYNDWSTRDFQFRDSSVGIGPGISKDIGSSIGPCIATPDEFGVESKLTARVDGEVWSEGNLENMHFSFEEIIEYSTLDGVVEPGDLLGSGTIGGGCGLEFDRYLEPGSTVELEADGIGLLRNRVGERTEGPQRQSWQRPA
ncbi:MAG: fumarylacetoacetate hydrolase family protein [Actinobacteria bacterium]|nr:fumarylacetoacetate hydrolase family protein [Actinomycetota bacterium]